MKPYALASTRVLGAFALAASTAFAQGGLFRGAGGLPMPPGSATGPGGSQPTPQNQGRGSASERESAPRPGSVPAILFSEERWEFWWEFNHDAYVNLRPSLLNAPSGGAAPAFAPFDADARGRILVPALVELLRDKEEVVRSAATLALARLQDPSVLPYLANAAVGDPSLPVRNNALIALGISRIPKAVERLKLTMFDETAPDESRVFAAVSLGMNGSPEGSATLRSALVVGSESALPYTVRLAATWALGLAGDPGNAPFLRNLVNAKGLDETAHALAIEAIGRVGDRAANATLVGALESPHSVVRRSAAIVLGVVGRPEDADVVRALEHALDADPDQTVRSFAALSLGRIAGIGAPAIVERLRARFKTETARQRSFLALALGISGYQAAGTELMAAFRDEGSESLRGAYATALALLDQKEAVPELRAAFRREKSPDLRGYLAYALGRLGDVDVANDLRLILAQQNSPQLLYWSSVALGLLGDRPAQQFLEEECRKGGVDQVTRGSWLYALGSIGDQTAAPFLIETAKSAKETAFMRALATAALGMLADEDRSPLTAAFSRDHNYTMSLAFVPELYYLF